MPPKRRRRPSPASKGLAAGERLKRSKLAGNDSSAWGWVGTEVSDPSVITPEHCLMTCGLSRRNKNPFCHNKFAPGGRGRSLGHEKRDDEAQEEQDDLIIVSDEESFVCSSKSCKNNPNCLNYLGQEKWQDEEKARRAFLPLSDLGDNPVYDSRDPDLPVGLKNLGATCYANAFLQVWFRDLAFRNGVYQCQPSQDTEHEYEDSPIFQLQVTFTALQESKRGVFNPSKLVESLRLSTSEQQDAQEFSKLFMSLLDHEFQKQLTPSLRSLIADQFQGQQVYGTICGKCHKGSEHVTDFLEIEINFENNSKLEDCITALLQPEQLTGDNKYLCSNCETLQEATRYTELRRLPPVVHFSLLRFVYDISSMERKKSKHSILFPASLNMAQFVGSRRKAPDTLPCGSEDVFDLRGVLLHKGPSAYHGHYEAQVFDVATQTWYQFDDETVTKLDSLGDPPKSSTVNGQSKSQVRPAKSTAKRKRIIETDDETLEAVDMVKSTASKASKARDVFSSKDAYMLIYARRNTVTTIQISKDELEPSSSAASRPSNSKMDPPSRALDVVRSLNSEHDESCNMFAKKEDELKAQFSEIRDFRRSIYTSWNINAYDDESVVVCRKTLENWLLDPITKQKEAAQPGDDDVAIVDSHVDVLCKHGGLDPRKSHYMKRMSLVAHNKIIASDKSIDLPVKGPHDVCEICVEAIFREKLYQVEHPRMVAQFDEACDIELEEGGYWISKSWLKDWRLSKPKSHSSLQDDLPPDAPEFNTHVKCEHGGLSLNITARRRISVEACEILQNMFPSWLPVSACESLCAICESSIQNSKEDKRELRKRVEDEKARLRHMHDNALTGNNLLLENVPCAAVPAQFIRLWRQWLNKPTDTARPSGIDNTQFLCIHEKLVFDPNCPSDFDSSIAVVQRSDWDTLEELYTCEPLIALEKRSVEGPNNDVQLKFFHDIPVCDDCRLQRKLDYETTELTVRVLNPGDVVPEPVSGEPDHTASQSSRMANGVRQSKRIRQGKSRGESRRLIIQKSNTVKDIKIMLHRQMKIPTICQRLFHRGQELQDNSATVESLGILINDAIDLREEQEDDDNLNSDSPGGKGPAEEKGFGGTLLASLPTDRSTSSREQTPTVTELKACPACTFCNEATALVCEMCEKSFT